jgi:hypothetical protein
MNWFDLLRGAAGAWLIQKPFQDSLSSQDELAPTFLAVQMAVLLVGVLAQILWLRRPIRVIGPVFYLTGLTLALSGPLTGGFALVMGFSCALIFGRLSAVFSLVPASLVAFGFLFHEFSVMTAFNAGAYALPAFLAFSFGTRISFVRRVAEIHGRYVPAPKINGHGVKAVPARQPAVEPVAREIGEVRAAPHQQPEAAPDVGEIIRPDFARPPVPAPAAAPARRVAGDPLQLPDFLRIAEEPEQPRRKARKGLFQRRGA